MADHSSSSISSSEPRVVPVREEGLTPRRVTTAVAVALAALIVIDLLIGRLTSMPASPLTMPTSLQQYFDYGRSVEAKFRRMVGTNEANTAIVAYAGWLDEQVIKPGPVGSGEIRVAVYGQSFAFHIADALTRQDERFKIVAKLGGPSAPFSHSYAAYRRGDTKGLADIVIVGILASSLPRLVSLTNTTTWFESPTPFTYPRYRLENSVLVATEPRIDSLDGLRRALIEPQEWREFVGQLSQHDAAFNNLLFESDIVDASSLGRLLRRGYGQRHIREVEQRYHQPDGFTTRDGLLDITKALAADIARIAANRGQVPCLLLIHDRGFDDHLVRALGEFLSAHGIPHFSTHVVAPPSDPRNFVIDGHFTSEINEKLATALRDRLGSLTLNGSMQSIKPP